jgi:hypothetical protein
MRDDMTINDSTHPSDAPASDGANTSQRKEYIALPRKQWIPKDDYINLHKYAKEQCAKLATGDICECEFLMPPTLWADTVGGGAHSYFGMVIAHMVRHGRLPLERLGCKYCSNLRYQRI